MEKPDPYPAVRIGQAGTILGMPCAWPVIGRMASQMRECGTDIVVERQLAVEDIGASQRQGRADPAERRHRQMASLVRTTRPFAQHEAKRDGC